MMLLAGLRMLRTETARGAEMRDAKLSKFKIDYDTSKERLATEIRIVEDLQKRIDDAKSPNSGLG
jgi:hypothetical protein